MEQLRTSAATCSIIPTLMPTFLSREIRGAGGIPGGTRPPPAARPVTLDSRADFLFPRNQGGPGESPAGQGHHRRRVPLPPILVLTFFSREIKGGRGESPGGTRPPPATRPVTLDSRADFLFPRNQGGWGKSPGGTRPPPAARPVIPLFFADFLFSRKESQRSTRAPPPFMSFLTSSRVAIEVSPGVVMARAP